MKRIHKVKTAVIVKDTIPDEKIEILRDNCNNLRDRAMIDFLLSTGIRVGELVRLNIDDIDFSERECVVYGKGDNGVELRLREMGKKLGVEKVHPHKFRRAMVNQNNVKMSHRKYIS